MSPPKAYKDKDTAYVSKNPIGTGPYRFVRWSKDEEIVLEAFAGHWRGAPKIKTVVFKPIPDDAVRVAALQNGEIDIAVNIPPHLGSIIDKHPKLFLSTAPSIRTIQLMFYTHEFDTKNKLVGPYQGPTADKRVRQAITYALDVDEIVKGVSRLVSCNLPRLFFRHLSKVSMTGPSCFLVHLGRSSATLLFSHQRDRSRRCSISCFTIRPRKTDPRKPI